MWNTSAGLLCVIGSFALIAQPAEAKPLTTEEVEKELAVIEAYLTRNQGKVAGGRQTGRDRNRQPRIGERGSEDPDPAGAADLDALQGTWLGSNGYTIVIRGNEVTWTSPDRYSGHTAMLRLCPRLGLWRETDELGTLERRYALTAGRLTGGAVAVTPPGLPSTGPAGRALASRRITFDNTTCAASTPAGASRITPGMPCAPE